MTGTPSGPNAFAETVDAFLLEYFARYPVHASGLGLHAYDGRVTDYGPEAIEAWMDRVRHWRSELARFDRERLSPDERLDLDTLDLALDHELFAWEELRDWRRNPMTYLWAIDTSGYLKRDYAPLADRVRAVARHLGAVPGLLAQARANLEPPLSRPLIQASRDMFAGAGDFMAHDLPAEAARLDAEETELRALLEDARAEAMAAVEAFVAFLDEELTRATDDFAIGARAFQRMLATGEAVSLPLERLLEIGYKDLERNLYALRSTAQAIDAEREPAEVMADLAEKHPRKSALVEETREMLEDLRAWIIEHEIVTVPSDVRIAVAETPAFMRWAFAMMDAPGAFEDVTDEAFYYVTPPDESWPEEQQAEWMTKFDYATLRDVSIHEAYPGHYVHFLHYRSTPSRVRRVFGAYSFWEAWAHYAEQMMMEAGYRPDDLELRLAQLSEALLRDVRYICAIQMHADGMTVDEAARMFEDKAFLAEKPARQEALRGTFDPGYLNYTLGKLMLLKLRDDYKARTDASGERFRLRDFHDAFLSYGAPPVPVVRRAMLGEGSGAVL